MASVWIQQRGEAARNVRPRLSVPEAQIAFLTLLKGWKGEARIGIGPWDTLLYSPGKVPGKDAPSVSMWLETASPPSNKEEARK